MRKRTRKIVTTILLILLIVVLTFGNFVLDLMIYSYVEHGELPSMFRYTGYYIPFGFSMNRMDDDFYVLTFSWRCTTLAFERDGVHLYGG